MRELDPTQYTVAWIAPLAIEAKAALCMLDNEHCGRFSLAPGDDYIYRAGDINGHNVAIATLPQGQEYGTGSAAALTAQMKRFFPNLWFGLLVGVAAGLPNHSLCPPRDIRLGDVLVSLSIGDSPGVVAYDLGKETGDGEFELLNGGRWLANTASVVLSAIGEIIKSAPDDVKVFLPFYETMRNKEQFLDPGQDYDHLHDLDSRGIEYCVKRELRPASERSRVWYGSIGSGEKLMKNGQKRNKLRDKYNLIGLEMEAAGIMNRIPVGIIRGVCDYGDKHKNKDWQAYAAAMAAAYAKAVIYQILSKVPSQQRSTFCTKPKRSPNNDWSFLRAAEKGDFETVIQFLQTDPGHRPSIKVQNRALFEASKFGHQSVVEYLLPGPDDFCSLNVNETFNEEIGNALHAAIAGGHEAIVNKLLEKKADPNVRCGLYPTTSLHVAIRYRRVRIIPLLISHGADVNVLDYHSMYPLEVAVDTRRWDIVRLLLRHGASLDCIGVGWRRHINAKLGKP